MGQYMKHCTVETEKLVHVGVGKGAVSVQRQAVALENETVSPSSVILLPYMPL